MTLPLRRFQPNQPDSPRWSGESPGYHRVSRQGTQQWHLTGKIQQIGYDLPHGYWRQGNRGTSKEELFYFYGQMSVLYEWCLSKTTWSRQGLSGPSLGLPHLYPWLCLSALSLATVLKKSGQEKLELRNFSLTSLKLNASRRPGRVQRWN